MHRSYRRPGRPRAIADFFERSPQRRAIVPASPRPRHQTAKIEQDEAPQAATAASPPPDRRFALRQSAIEQPFDAKASGREPHRVFIDDISRTGIRFQSDVGYLCGSVVTIVPPATLPLEPMDVRIVRARMVDPSMAERGFEYGSEYVMLNEQAHAWFLATRAKR